MEGMWEDEEQKRGVVAKKTLDLLARIEGVAVELRPEAKRSNVVQDSNQDDTGLSSLAAATRFLSFNTGLKAWIDTIEKASIYQLKTKGSHLRLIVSRLVPVMRSALQHHDPETLNGLARLLTCQITAYKSNIDSRNKEKDFQKSTELDAANRTLQACMGLVEELEESKVPYEMSSRLKQSLSHTVLEWQHEATFDKEVGQVVRDSIPALKLAIKRGNVVFFVDLLNELHGDISSSSRRKSKLRSKLSSSPSHPSQPNMHPFSGTHQPKRSYRLQPLQNPPSSAAVLHDDKVSGEQPSKHAPSSSSTRSQFPMSAVSQSLERGGIRRRPSDELSNSFQEEDYDDYDMSADEPLRSHDSSYTSFSPTSPSSPSPHMHATKNRRSFQFPSQPKNGGGGSSSSSSKLAAARALRRAAEESKNNNLLKRIVEEVNDTPLPYRQQQQPEDAKNSRNFPPHRSVFDPEVSPSSIGPEGSSMDERLKKLLQNRSPPQQDYKVSEAAATAGGQLKGRERRPPGLESLDVPKRPGMSRGEPSQTGAAAADDDDDGDAAAAQVCSPQSYGYSTSNLSEDEPRHPLGINSPTTSVRAYDTPRTDASYGSFTASLDHESDEKRQAAETIVREEDSYNDDSWDGPAAAAAAAAASALSSKTHSNIDEQKNAKMLGSDSKKAKSSSLGHPSHSQAAIKLKSKLRRRKIERVFKAIDSSRAGYVSIEQIISAMAKKPELCRSISYPTEEGEIDSETAKLFISECFKNVGSFQQDKIPKEMFIRAFESPSSFEGNRDHLAKRDSFVSESLFSITSNDTRSTGGQSRSEFVPSITVDSNMDHDL